MRFSVNDTGEGIPADRLEAVFVRFLQVTKMILYPSTSLHNVRPVTRGARVAYFFWLQSMIRDDGQRTLSFDLDTAIQRLAAGHPDHPSAVQLTGVYHNLLRRWAAL